MFHVYYIDSNKYIIDLETSTIIGKGNKEWFRRFGVFVSLYKSTCLKTVSSESQNIIILTL